MGADMNVSQTVVLVPTCKFSVLGFEKEKADESILQEPQHATSTNKVKRCRRVFLDVNEPYTRRLIQRAFLACDKGSFITTVGPGYGMEPVIMPPQCEFQWAEYERIDWSSVLAGKHGASSYCIRKGLSRKAQLAHYTHRHVCKFPESILKQAIPRTLILDTWAVWEGHGSILTSSNAGLADIVVSQNSLNSHNQREKLDQCFLEARRVIELAEEQYKNQSDLIDAPVWILKGSTVNKGGEIYIVHLYEQLVDICWNKSEVREWVLQQYISRPLLLRQRKFHVRAYILAVGNLKVYFCRECLALCSASRYSAHDTTNLLAHITNTAYQDMDPSFREDQCVLLWNGDLVEKILVKDGTCPRRADAKNCVEKTISDMQAITSELFRAYANEFGVFSPLEKCWEHYGLDFMVDQNWQVFLLEVNPGPDFKQTGSQLENIIERLMTSTIELALMADEFSRAENLSLVYQKERGSSADCVSQYLFET